MSIENASTIYYMSKKGIVQDGQQWLEDCKHGIVTLGELSNLKECFWSAVHQKWELEPAKKEGN